MKYQLIKYVSRNKYVFNLRKADYDEYIKARNILRMAITIEEAFDVLIDNYLEFETTLLQSTNQYLVRSGKDLIEFQSERKLFNRRLINLLTTSRAYLDSTDMQLCNKFGERSTQRKKFSEKREFEYNSHLGYRVMESLRNHVQHYGCPIHLIEHSSQLIGNISNIQEAKNAKNRYIIQLFMNTNSLKENINFKKNILNELELISKKGNIDLRLIIREYIEALADIHLEVRKIIKSVIVESQEIIIAEKKRFNNKFSKIGPNGLVLVKIDNAKRIFLIGPFDILLESLAVLENKNGELVYLSKRYVSNEII